MKFGHLTTKIHNQQVIWLENILKSAKLRECPFIALVLSHSYLFSGLQLHRCSKVNNFNSCIFPLGADHVLGLKQSFWLNTVFIISETSYLGAAQVHFTDTASQVQGSGGSSSYI